MAHHPEGIVVPATCLTCGHNQPPDLLLGSFLTGCGYADVGGVRKIVAGGVSLYDMKEYVIPLQTHS